MAEPDTVRIVLEDEGDRFDLVGRLPDGTQFLAIVVGAVPNGELPDGVDWQDHKRWLAVLHRFDGDGHHLGTRTRLGGFDREGRDEAGDKAAARLREMLDELSGGAALELCDIRVRPFLVTIDGFDHGLVYEAGDDFGEGDGPMEWVSLVPWCVQFVPPWDGGEYDT